MLQVYVYMYNCDSAVTLNISSNIIILQISFYKYKKMGALIKELSIHDDASHSGALSHTHITRHRRSSRRVGLNMLVSNFNRKCTWPYCPQHRCPHFQIHASASDVSKLSRHLHGLGFAARSRCRMSRSVVRKTTTKRDMGIRMGMGMGIGIGIRIRIGIGIGRRHGGGVVCNSASPQRCSI